MSSKGNWLYRLERKFGKYCIPNLMLYIVGVMALVYVADWVIASSAEGFSLSSYLYFDRDLVLSGQVWRCVTFIFLPPDTSLLFIVFSLYFDVLLGQGLEQQWGVFRFNLFYLCGMLLSLAGGFIMGDTTNAFLNASMFFAFALFYPDFEMLIFFIIPIKIKWLAIIDAVFYVLMFLFNTWPNRIALLLSLANLLLFFWEDIVWNFHRLRQNARIRKMRDESRRRY